MGYMVGRESDHGSKTCKQLDDRIYYNKDTRAYRDRDKQDKHPHVGEQPSKGQQDTEYGTRSTDGQYIFSPYRMNHLRAEHTHPYQLLCEGSAQTADEVIYEELLLAPLTLQYGCKHQHGEHVEEYMIKIGMQKHVGQRLPNMETIGGPIMEPQQVVQV